MLALSKMWTSIFCLSKGVHMKTTSGQSAWEIWIYFSVPETVFQESAAKVAICNNPNRIPIPSTTLYRGAIPIRHTAY